VVVVAALAQVQTSMVAAVVLVVTVLQWLAKTLVVVRQRKVFPQFLQVHTP
jgi:hypothetical protein